VQAGQEEQAEKLSKQIWSATDAALAGGQEPIVRQPRGLTNMGNLCFMNAVLQGLVGCSAFFRLLDGMKVVENLPSTMPTLQTLISLAAEFVQVEAGSAAACAGGGDGATESRASSGGGSAEGEWQTGRANQGAQSAGAMGAASVAKHGPPLTPNYFYEQVKDFAPSDPVRPGRGKARQEDAQEFLCFLLNALHDELIKVLKCAPKPEGSKGAGGTSARGASAADGPGEDGDAGEAAGGAGGSGSGGEEGGASSGDGQEDDGWVEGKRPCPLLAAPRLFWPCLRPRFGPSCVVVPVSPLGCPAGGRRNRPQGAHA